MGSQLQTATTEGVSLLVGEPRARADAQRREQVLFGEIRRIHSGGFGEDHREQMGTATAIVETSPGRIDERFVQNIGCLIRGTMKLAELGRACAQPAPFVAWCHRPPIVERDTTFLILEALDHRAERICQRLFGPLDETPVDGDSNEHRENALGDRLHVVQRPCAGAVEVPLGHELTVLPDQEALHTSNLFRCSEGVGERLFRLPGLEGHILRFGPAGEEAKCQCHTRCASSCHGCSPLAA